MLTELGKAFNIRTIPRYLIFDKNGNVANAESGGPSRATTLKEIEGLLLK